MLAADSAALPRATSPLPHHKDSSSSSRKCVHKGRSPCCTCSAASSSSSNTLRPAAECLCCHEGGQQQQPVPLQTLSHVLLECPVAREVWEWFVGKWRQLVPT